MSRDIGFAGQELAFACQELAFACQARRSFLPLAFGDVTCVLAFGDVTFGGAA
jgi:hypothetical protein